MSNFKDLVRVGKDAVVRNAGGKPVTGFSAAFDSGWGDKKQTVWLDCSAWGERYTKVSEYITKGSLVLVEGELGTREHEGKTYLTLNVSELKLTAKANGEKRQERTGGGGQTPQAEVFPDDDIPFATPYSTF